MARVRNRSRNRSRKVSRRVNRSRKVSRRVNRSRNMSRRLKRTRNRSRRVNRSRNMSRRLKRTRNRSRRVNRSSKVNRSRRVNKLKYGGASFIKSLQTACKRPDAEIAQLDELKRKLIYLHPPPSTLAVEEEISKQKLEQKVQEFSRKYMVDPGIIRELMNRGNNGGKTTPPILPPYFLDLDIEKQITMLYRIMNAANQMGNYELEEKMKIILGGRRAYACKWWCENIKKFKK